MTAQSHTADHPAVASLRGHQTQLDDDGVMVGVSRQAVVEMLALYDGLLEALRFYANPEVYRPHPHGPAFDRRDLSFVASAAIMKAAGPACERCGGRGEIGGPAGQTAETFEWVTEPCPDCMPKATGEAGAMSGQAHAAGASLEDASKWTMVEAGHYNGGKEWFGYLHRCVEQPRLSRFDRYTRKDKSVTSTWRIDGEDMETFSDAVSGLARPPCLTIEEVAVLAQVGTEPADLRKVHPYAVMWSLHNKGAVAYGPPGRSRRVVSDADVLDQLSRLESNASGNPEWEAVSAKVAAARAVLAKAAA